MMYAAMLAGIAFNAAGCHLPHGLSYAVSGLAKDWHVAGYPDGKTARAARHGGRAQQSVGWRYTAPCCPDASSACARMPRRATRAARRPTTPAKCSPARHRADAGDANAERPVRARLRRHALDALATGAEPQYRVIKNAPNDVGRDDLKRAVSARRCATGRRWRCGGARCAVASAAGASPHRRTLDAPRRQAHGERAALARARCRSRARPGGAAARA